MNTMQYQQSLIKVRNLDLFLVTSDFVVSCPEGLIRKFVHYGYSSTCYAVIIMHVQRWVVKFSNLYFNNVCLKHQNHHYERSLVYLELIFEQIKFIIQNNCQTWPWKKTSLLNLFLWSIDLSAVTFFLRNMLVNRKIIGWLSWQLLTTTGQCLFG